MGTILKTLPEIATGFGLSSIQTAIIYDSWQENLPKVITLPALEKAYGLKKSHACKLISKLVARRIVRKPSYGKYLVSLPKRSCSQDFGSGVRLHKHTTPNEAYNPMPNGPKDPTESFFDDWEDDYDEGSLRTKILGIKLDPRMEESEDPNHSELPTELDPDLQQILDKLDAEKNPFQPAFWPENEQNKGGGWVQSDPGTGVQRNKSGKSRFPNENNDLQEKISNDDEEIFNEENEQDFSESIRKRLLEMGVNLESGKSRFPNENNDLQEKISNTESGNGGEGKNTCSEMGSLTGKSSKSFNETNEIEIGSNFSVVDIATPEESHCNLINILNKKSPEDLSFYKSTTRVIPENNPCKSITKVVPKESTSYFNAENTLIIPSKGMVNMVIPKEDLIDTCDSDPVPRDYPFSEPKVPEEDPFAKFYDEEFPLPESAVQLDEKFCIELDGFDVVVTGKDALEFALVYQDKFREYNNQPYVRVIRDGYLCKSRRSWKNHVVGAAVCKHNDFNVRRFVEAQFFFHDQWRGTMPSVKYLTSVGGKWDAEGRYRKYCERFKDDLNYFEEGVDNIDRAYHTQWIPDPEQEMRVRPIAQAQNEACMEHWADKGLSEYETLKMLCVPRHMHLPEWFVEDNPVYHQLLRDRAWGDLADDSDFCRKVMAKIDHV